MTVVQHRSDQQQSLNVFDKFDVLPAEIRAMIWREALDEEAKTRFLPYHEFYGEIGDSIGDKAVFFPHKNLRSSLCKYIPTYSSADAILANILEVSKMTSCCHVIVQGSPRAP